MAMTLVRKIGSKLYTLMQIAVRKLHYWKISTDPHIDLGDSCIIDSSAKVETKFGGRISIGQKTELLDGVVIQTYGGNIKIGSHCSINAYTVIYGHGNTTIGDNVLIAGGCMIIPSNHTFSDANKLIREQASTSKGITIENNVWIGHGCSILDGVVIGEGSVIAAGSVVNASIPPFSVVGGVPAKIIKTRA
jgi:acetyltransferase-like isoleucine patch superfamily enzyme